MLGAFQAGAPWKLHLFIIGSLMAACGRGGWSCSSASTEQSVELAPGVYATEISFSDGSTVDSADAATLLSPPGELVYVPSGIVNLVILEGRPTRSRYWRRW